MKLLVLGATGACGTWVTRLAATRGHEVTAVARPTSPITPPPKTRVVRGQVTEPAFLAPLLENQDAVISCLGLRRASVIPWSRLLSPPDLVQRVSVIVAQSAAAASLNRFVWISAGGVRDSRGQASFLVRQAIGAGNVRVAYRDLEQAENLLDDSPVPSLAVRPVTLVSGRPTARAGPVSRYGLFSFVRRSDVSQWMLNVADGTSPYSDRHVLLGSTF